MVQVNPTLYLPMNMCWHESAGAAVDNFTQSALEVSRRRHWLHEGELQAAA
jgi:hypothetical protein